MHLQPRCGQYRLMWKRPTLMFHRCSLNRLNVQCHDQSYSMSVRHLSLMSMTGRRQNARAVSTRIYIYDELRMQTSLRRKWSLRNITCVMISHLQYGLNISTRLLCIVRIHQSSSTALTSVKNVCAAFCAPICSKYS